MEGMDRFSGAAVPHSSGVVVRAAGQQVPSLRLVHQSVHVVGVSLQGLYSYLYSKYICYLIIFE